MHYVWNAFAQHPSMATITAKHGGSIAPSDDFTEVRFSKF